MNILSDPTTGSLLGIGGIVATFIVGVTIFRMQQRADRSINNLIEKIHELTKEQHRVIHHEDERKKSIKRYFIRRINADFERTNTHYNDLKQRIQQRLENKSEESWKKLSNFSNEFFPRIIDSFMTVTDDIKIIVPFLDNPYLIDKFGLIALFGGQLKGCAAELGKYQESTIKTAKILSSTSTICLALS